MQHRLIDHSPDLIKLRNEGYEIYVQDNYVVIQNIPYVNSNIEIKQGILVSPLTISGVKVGKPKNHVIFFAGEYPCHKDGRKVMSLRHSDRRQKLLNNLEVNHSFSNKPKNGFQDYYEKFTSYINIISGPAQALNPDVTPRSFKLLPTINGESPFIYPDTNSSRAGVSSISEKLKRLKVGIIGVGGTGSYILDFLAKCPVMEIRLYDNDEFLAHNAYRSPGAPSLEELNDIPKKATYFKNIYSKMHGNIVAYDKYITSSNLHDLQGLDFVFICVDQGGVKPKIFEYLSLNEISFIDVGMGIQRTKDDSLTGIIRATHGANGRNDHIIEKKLISMVDDNDNDEYSSNIQIAELNALNAVMAIIKWKKLFGFYTDSEESNHSLYTIEDNTILNAYF